MVLARRLTLLGRVATISRTVVGASGPAISSLEAFREGRNPHSRGLQAAEGRARRASTQKRREIAERIAAAREFGEIAENAEYDDAKNEQMMLEHRIAQLEERLANAQVIDKRRVDTSVVSIGAVVRLRDVDAKETTEYFIVGSAEANPAERKLERVAGRQGDHGAQEGRDRRGHHAARLGR